MTAKVNSKENVRAFIDKFIIKTNDLNDKIQRKNLYQHYKQHSDYVFLRNTFYKELELMDFTKYKSHGYEFYRGMKLTD